MHFIVWLPRLTYEKLELLIRKAAASDLGIYPVHHYYKVKPAKPGLLIGYAGLSSATLRTAAELLARCITTVNKMKGVVE